MKKRFENDIVPAANVEAKAALAQELKKARLQSNLTQETLADRIGTEKSNISRMESGKYNPSLDFLVKVADGLGRKIVISVGEE